jgi:hypothetical protein
MSANHPGERHPRPFLFGTTGVMIARAVALHTQAIHAERFIWPTHK